MPKVWPLIQVALRLQVGRACCTMCKKDSNKFLLISCRVHLFSHHPEKSRQNLTVEDALAQANSGSGGRGQQRASSSSSASDSVPNLKPDEMKFQCPECLSQFDAWLDLVAHVGDHGVKAEIEQSSPSRDPVPPTHKCELCYKSFASEDRLQVRNGFISFVEFRFAKTIASAQ